MAKTRPQLSHDGALSRLEVRGKALEDVVKRSNERFGSGRVKGKVGIITGVGPALGIGVSTNGER